LHDIRVKADTCHQSEEAPASTPEVDPLDTAGDDRGHQGVALVPEAEGSREQILVARGQDCQG